MVNAQQPNQQNAAQQSVAQQAQDHYDALTRFGKALFLALAATGAAIIGYSAICHHVGYRAPVPQHEGSKRSLPNSSAVYVIEDGSKLCFIDNYVLECEDSETAKMAANHVDQIVASLRYNKNLTLHDIAQRARVHGIGYEALKEPRISRQMVGLPEKLTWTKK